MSKKGPTGDFLFSFLQTSFFFSKNGQYLPTKQKEKEKEKDLRPPDWPQLRPPAGQETDFFLLTA